MTFRSRTRSRAGRPAIERPSCRASASLQVPPFCRALPLCPAHSFSCRLPFLRQLPSSSPFSPRFWSALPSLRSTAGGIVHRLTFFDAEFCRKAARGLLAREPKWITTGSTSKRKIPVAPWCRVRVRRKNPTPVIFCGDDGGDGDGGSRPHSRDPPARKVRPDRVAAPRTWNAKKS